MTDDDLEKRIRAALDAAAAHVEPTGTLADLRARIRGATVNTHLCPARYCSREVPDHLLMCGPHWRIVPAPLARAVNRAYRGPGSVGTPALVAAQLAAIRHVNNAIGGTPDE